MRESLAQLGETVRVQLWPDRQRRLELIAEPARPGHVQQMRSVDVEHVQSDGNLGDALSLRDQLLGQSRRRHHVEHVDGVERDRPLPAKPAGRDRAVMRLGIRLARTIPQGGDQCVAVGEPPVQRGACDAGRRGDVGEARRGGSLKDALGRVENPLAVACGIWAQGHELMFDRHAGLMPRTARK